MHQNLPCIGCLYIGDASAGDVIQAAKFVGAHDFFQFQSDPLVRSIRIEHAAEGGQRAAGDFRFEVSGSQSAGPRPYPAFGDIQWMENRAFSDYHSLQVGLEKVLVQTLKPIDELQ